IPKSRRWLSLTLMKNWEVALLGSFVRAMAIVPRELRRPFLASFRMAGPVGSGFGVAGAGCVAAPWGGAAWARVRRSAGKSIFRASLGWNDAILARGMEPPKWGRARDYRARLIRLRGGPKMPGTAWFS